MPSSSTEQRLGKLPLVLGMRVIVSQNFDVNGGIVNGSTGILKRIRFKLDDNGDRVLTSCVVTLDDETPALPGFEPSDAPILADVRSFTIKHPFSGRWKKLSLISNSQALQNRPHFTASTDTVGTRSFGCKSLVATEFLRSPPKKSTQLGVPCPPNVYPSSKPAVCLSQPRSITVTQSRKRVAVGRSTPHHLFKAEAY
ncbi:hypothetical protein BC629DRAFT_1457923, partial [Irpex lacteus]